MSIATVALNALKLYFGAKAASTALNAILGPEPSSIGYVAALPAKGSMTKGGLKLSTFKVRNLDDRMRHIIRLTQSGREDPRIRKATARVINRKCGDKWCLPEKDWDGEVRAIFNYCRNNVRYTRDIEGKDLYQAANRTLELKGGDCASYSILLGSMLLSAGYPVKFRVIRTNEAKSWNHIFVLAGVPMKSTMAGASSELKWVSLDASVPKAPGWHAPMSMIGAIKDYAVK